MPETVTAAIVAADDPGFWGGTVTAITRGLVRVLADPSGAGDVGTARTLALSWKYEQTYSKQEILHSYVNAVALGRGAFGVEAAAQVYFDKTADRRADRKSGVRKAVRVARRARGRGRPKPARRRR